MNEISKYIEDLSGLNKNICVKLKEIIDNNLHNSTSKIYHGSPVWFIKENPVLGFSIKKSGIALLFWSGQSFTEDGLNVIGKYKAAEILYNNEEDLDEEKIKKWIKESLSIQWNYKDIVKKQGLLELLDRE